MTVGAVTKPHPAGTLVVVTGTSVPTVTDGMRFTYNITALPQDTSLYGLHVKARNFAGVGDKSKSIELAKVLDQSSPDTQMTMLESMR